MSNITQQFLEKKVTVEEAKAADNQESISKRRMRELKDSANKNSKEKKSAMKSSKKMFSTCEEAKIIDDKPNSNGKAQPIIGTHTSASKPQPDNNPFTQPNPFSQPPQPFQPRNIFSESHVPATNIFASMAKKRDPSNIFSKTKNSINLFQSKPTYDLSSTTSAPAPATNIFVAATAENSICLGDDGSDTESESVSVNEEVVNPALSKGKYEYQNQFEKLYTGRVLKFKHGEESLQNDLTVSIEKAKDSCTMLVLRSPLTLLLTYQAIIIPKKAQVDTFMGKQQNAKMYVYRHVEAGKFKRQLVKFQFEDEIACKQFRIYIENLDQKKQQARTSAPTPDNRSQIDTTDKPAQNLYPTITVLEPPEDCQKNIKTD